MEAITRPFFGLVGVVLAAWVGLTIITHPAMLFTAIGSFATALWTFISSAGH